MKSETRQNLVAIAIGLGISALIFAFFMRPAVVLPVGARTVENAIGVLNGDASHLEDRSKADPHCRKRKDGGFDCSLASFSPGDLGSSYGPPIRGDYVVEVDGPGCWSARHPGRDRTVADGCINLTDYFGY